MSERLPDPSTITKPIQLLAAWFSAMVALDAVLLGAAATLSRPEWASGLLVIAAVAFPAAILASVFLLQTRFRPAMLSDQSYNEHVMIVMSQKSGLTETVKIQETNNVDITAAKIIISDLSPNMKVLINDYLPYYSAILVALEKNGITVNRSFGSTSYSTSRHLPLPFIMAIGSGCSLTDFQRVFHILLNFELDGVGFSKLEEDIDNIFIGAYGYDTIETRYIASDSQEFEELRSTTLTRERYLTIILTAD